jgi:hypothetical protein
VPARVRGGPSARLPLHSFAEYAAACVTWLLCRPVSTAAFTQSCVHVGRRCSCTVYLLAGADFGMLRSRCRRIPTNSQSPSSCRWSPTCHALPHTPPHQQPVCASTASAAKLGEAAAAAHPTNTSGTHTVRTLMLPQPVSFPQELRKVSVERSGPKQATAIKESALPASLVPERRKSPAATATPMITSANISENLSAIIMCVPGERYISIFGGACLSAPPRDCFLRPTHGATPCALCTPPCLARVVQMAMAAQRAPTDA